jgi:peptidoglycan/xylan/chitin deacetylase (PgdA/CDA1 family)
MPTVQVTKFVYAMERNRGSGIVVSEVVENSPQHENSDEAETGGLPDLADLPATMSATAAEILSVPILAYHNIDEEGPPELSRWRIAPAQFSEQMRFLQQHGYYSISLDEWADCIRAERSPGGRPVVITFDDGYKDFITNAVPVLTAAGFSATVFVVTDRVGGAADWDPAAEPRPELMSWDDLRALAAGGFRIASHTTAHRDLITLEDEEIERDSRAARAVLYRELGYEVDAVAFPGGSTDLRVRAALARGGYRIGVGVASRRSTFTDDIACLPRIEVYGEDDLASFARKLSDPSSSLAPERIVYVGDAVRRSQYRVDAVPGYFEFRGVSLFLHPPRDGRTRLEAAAIASGAPRARFSCVLVLSQYSARPVRFFVRLTDTVQSIAREAVVKPGQRCPMSLLLDGFQGPLSIEFATEMHGGPGSNDYAWATFHDPSIEYLTE